MTSATGHLKIALLLCGAGQIALAAPAWGQDAQPAEAAADPPAQDAGADSQGADIVVVARKREERLSKVPETIQAFTSEAIAKAGITSLDSLGQRLPNVVLNRRQGDNEPNVVIRGVGSFGNTQGVGFYIDDVQNFTDQSAPIEDVERIEVLKGPQGTLYGGSNVGGAVKYIMRRPGRELTAQGRIEYGGFDTLNLFGAVDVPLNSDGSLAVRVSGFANRSDGYIPNTNLGIFDDRSKELGGRVAIRWEPSDRLAINFNYRHSYLSGAGNANTRASNLRDYHRTIDYDVDTYNHKTVDGAVLQADLDLSAFSLTSITSYTHRKTRLRWEADFSPDDVAYLVTGDRDGTNVFTQELRVTSDTSGPFDYIIGGYYSHVTNRSPVNDSDLILGISGGGPFRIDGFFNADAAEDQYALFATANYSFGALKVGGGLRLNRTEFVADLPNVQTGPTRRGTASTRLLPKLSIAYDVSPDVMVYANAAIGMEPGRVNLTSDTGDAYRPEKATNYEMGIKGIAFDRRLSFELAGFYIDYRDRQQETASNINGVVVEQIFNVGNSRSFGLEGSLSYRPTRNVTLSVSGGFLDAQWRSGTYTFPPVAEGEVPTTIPVRGFAVPFSPKVSGTASVDWTVPVGALEIGFRADVTHRSSQYWDIPNRGRSAPYQLVNLRVGLSDAGHRWELALRAENVFNTNFFNEFIYGVFDTPAAGGSCAACHLAVPGAPRRVMGSLRFNF